MKLQTTPTERKPMVNAISELLGVPATYLRTPTYAFRIGCVIVNRDGTTDCDNPAELERLIPMLIESGYLAEAPVIVRDPSAEPETYQEPHEGKPQAEEPAATSVDEELYAAPRIQESGEAVTEMTLTVPITGMEPGDLRNLVFTLYSKQHLINKAVGGGELFIHDNVISRLQEIEFESTDQFIELLADFKGLDELRGISLDENHFSMSFPSDGRHTDDLTIYALLLSKVFESCKVTKRVRPILYSLGDNEKYLMHSWLIRLGCGGSDFKALRKRMTEGLAGFCAFPDQKRADKHKAKYAEIRRIRREISEEVTCHDE